MNRHHKSIHRQRKQYFNMFMMTLMLLFGMYLAYAEKDMTQYVALAGLFFTYCGAVLKFHYESKPSGEDEV